jgi:hypothetical protein
MGSSKPFSVHCHTDATLSCGFPTVHFSKIKLLTSRHKLFVIRVTCVTLITPRLALQNQQGEILSGCLDLRQAA